MNRLLLFLFVDAAAPAGGTGPASAVQASGNLLFSTREGNLTADGSLVKPVPGKGHVIPITNP